MHTRITPEWHPGPLPPGATHLARFRLDNVGTSEVRSRPRKPLNLGGRWINASTGESVQETERHPLGHRLTAGASRHFALHLCVPLEPGEYTLRVGAVVEGPGWLDELRPESGWAGTVQVGDF